MITSAFTCTGPYAVLIMLGIKLVENRSAMPVPTKGRCAVGCSKSFNAAEYGNFAEDAARVFRAAIPIAGKNEGFFVLPFDAERRALSPPVLVSLVPSREDVELTRRLCSAADLLGVKLLDHLIVTQEGMQPVVSG